MDKNQDIPRIRKGDAFVQMEPHPLVFMEINEVKGDAGNKDFCIVTWYSLDEKGTNAQRRFPMESIDEVYSEVSKVEDTTIENASGFTKFKEGDLLWAKITPCMQN